MRHKGNEESHDTRLGWCTISFTSPLSRTVRILRDFLACFEIGCVRTESQEGSRSVPILRGTHLVCYKGTSLEDVKWAMFFLYQNTF